MAAIDLLLLRNPMPPLSSFEKYERYAQKELQCGYRQKSLRHDISNKYEISVLDTTVPFSIFHSRAM